MLESLIRKLLNEQKSTVTPGETPSNPLGSTSKSDNHDDSVGKTENPIKCDICKKMFKCYDNLKTHDEKSILKRRGIMKNSINVTNVMLLFQGKAKSSLR